MGRMAILERFEHEHEHEKKLEQYGAPKSPAVLSSLFESWSPATTVTTVIISQAIA